MPFNPTNLWEFSNTVYAREEVANACLDLQDAYDIDINLLLFACWYGYFFGEFDESSVDQALDFSRIWKMEVVQPLRNVRVWMKANSAKFTNLDTSQYSILRERIKFDELAAEKIQQQALEILVQNVDIAPINKHSQLVAAMSNVRKLLNADSIEMDEVIETKLTIILNSIQDKGLE